MKKDPSGRPPALALAENPDILRTIAARPDRPRLVIGFAAETDDLVANATAKRARKGADWIVANDVSPATGIMGGTENAVTLITAAGAEPWPRMSQGRHRRGAGRPHRRGAGMSVARRHPAPAGHDPALPLPAYATAGAAGMDLCAYLPPADRAAGLTLAPGARALVPSGLALEIPPGHEVQLRPRSGLALRDGLTASMAPAHGWTLQAEAEVEPGLSWSDDGGRARRRSGDLPLFRRTLCRLSYSTVRIPSFGIGPIGPISKDRTAC